MNKIDLEMKAHVAHDREVVEPARIDHARDLREDEARANVLRNRIRAGFAIGLAALAGIGIHKVHRANETHRVAIDHSTPTLTEQTPTQDRLLQDMDRADNPDGKDANSQTMLPEDNKVHVK